MRFVTVTAACVAVFAGGGVASATDLSLKDPPVYTPAPPPPGWSGPYIGGHLGALWTGDRTISALEQVCRKPDEGGGGDDGGHGGGDDHAGGGKDDYPGGGKDDDDDDGHDCKKDHYGEEHDDRKHGKRGRGSNGRKKHASAPVRMSVAPKPATPSAPICTDFTKTSNVTFVDDRDDVVLIGGVHVGYNWQRQSALLGIEADADFADGYDYLASLRGRLGYVSGDFLLFATAGIAFAALDDNIFSFKTPIASHSFDRGDDTQIGAVVGAGVEYKLRSNVSVGLEGLYYFFGDDSNTVSVTEGDSTFRVTEELDNDVWTLRARVSYHFGVHEEDEALK